MRDDQELIGASKPRRFDVGTPTPAAPDAAWVTDLAERLRSAISTVIEGKPDVIESALIVLLAQGHLLIEDVPGVGKTQLAKALGRSISGSVGRIQFTPDLLPSDITGVSVFNPDNRTFEFRHGPIFANVVIADEINRSTPKTQSALLECLEERHVSVDGISHPLPAPFLVIATQNPLEMEGTFALPEAQRDRFMARISVGYPSLEAEVAMVATHASHNPLDQLRPVTTISDLADAIGYVRTLHVSAPVMKYAVSIVARTRSHPEVALGASPRASVHLIQAARAKAALQGRSFVLPDDVASVAATVLAHRLVTHQWHADSHQAAQTIIGSILAAVAVPQSS